MSTKAGTILLINGGSSSLKFAICETEAPYSKLIWGKLDRIEGDNARLLFSRRSKTEQSNHNVLLAHHQSSAYFLFEWLKHQREFNNIAMVGHRIVHGTADTCPKLLSEELLKELRIAAKLAPNHLPGAVHLIDVAKKYLPGVSQVACFDSDFHQTIPLVARLLPIPRRYSDIGVYRYGYHGISCNYVMEELQRLGKKVANGGIVIAHLGNGSSLTAIKNGQSIDTTMGFTPAGGICMSSRSGDIDPGIILHLLQKENLGIRQLNELVNKHSGLLGISEISSDVRTLLECAKDDVRAAEAIDLYCYQVKKVIGAYAAALNGLTILVFTGGIGENQAAIRQRICDGLGFLGIKIDTRKNRADKKNISSAGSKVKVLIINSDEEWMMAKIICSKFNETGYEN